MNSPSEPTLFDKPVARLTDPQTSHEAAASLEPHVSRLMQIVLDHLATYGPATIEQVADYSGLSLVSISPRFKPLAKLGKIADTGERRQNRSGRSAIAWRAV